MGIADIADLEFLEEGRCRFIKGLLRRRYPLENRRVELIVRSEIGDHRVDGGKDRVGARIGGRSDRLLCDPRELLVKVNLQAEARNAFEMALLKKADHAGLEVRCETSDAFVDDLWRMVVAVFAKSDRRPGFERGFIEAVWNQLGGSDRLLVLSAFHRGQRVSSRMFLCNDLAMYDLVAGADVEHLDKSPNHMLVWNAILQAQRRGFRQVDFISNSQFKASFGTQLRERATHWARSRTPLDGLAKRCYEHYVRWRRGAHWRPR